MEWSGVVGCQGSICSEKTLIRFSIENNILIQVFLYLSILLFPLLAACCLLTEFNKAELHPPFFHSIWF